MKKIFCLAVIVLFLASCVATNKIPESKVQSRAANYISLSTLLTYFETGDRPTQDEFEDAWSNSYNSVSDGMWDMTGYPSISFAPYTSLQVGKFYTGALWPNDTTTVLVYNGTLKVPNLWVNGQKYTGTGSSDWSLAGGVIYPTSTSTNMAIGATTSSGYDLFVNGTTYSLTSLRTRMLNLENSIGDNGTVSIDAFGNLQFTDMFNSTAITLSSLAGSAAWNKVLGQISPTTTTDTISVGAVSGDSLFNVYGTSYFEDAAYFDGLVDVDAPILTDEYIETPAVNFAYGTKTGRIDLYNASGKLTAYDVDYPTGVTLAQLASKLTLSGVNLYPTSSTYNLALGATDALGYKLRVNGTSYFSGTSLFTSGISIPIAQKINFPTSYVYENGGVLRFSDAVTGEKTLAELVNPLGTTMDSLSVSKLNVDTMYFNGSQYKSFFSPHTNTMYIKNQNAMFSFEYFNPMAVLGLGALRFALANDTMKSNPAWPELGKFIINEADTVPELYAGAVRGWEKMATRPWVTNAILGGIGGNPMFDTVFFSANTYMTKEPTASVFKFASRDAFGDTLTFSFSSSTSIRSSKDSGLEFFNDSISLKANSVPITWNGVIMKTLTDTIATLDDIRTLGGGGTGTPGGSVNDLQYNNAGSFGGFWAYDGTDIVPTAGAGISWAATSFIEGYAADSVRLGRTASMTNSYASETGQKNNFKSIQGYAGGYLNSLSKVYMNYNDANANNGLAYGVYSHLYSDENYATSGNTSYSNAGRFILQNRGTTTIGGGSPGTVYLNGLYGEITGAINADATPGTYYLAAVFGKDSHTGTAVGYAGYFDGDVNINGDLLHAGPFVLGNGSSNTGIILTSDWNISSTGVMSGISGITNDAAITSTGGIVSLNASSNYAINLATGTSTGAVSIGGGSNTVAVNSTSWDISTAGAVTGLTTLSMSGQLTSTLATGTSPLAVTSTTVNTNLNADLLDGQSGSYYQTATNINAGTLPGDRGVTAGSATSSFIEYNGTTRTPGQMYGGTSDPTGTIRGNYDGYWYATRHYGEFYIPRVAAETDTFAAVIYPGGHIDTASLAFSASRGWEIELEDFDTYYAKAESLKALPLPYPNGKERRKVNPFYSNYQLEFELERLTRYLKAEREDKKLLEARIAKLEESANLPKKIRKSRINFKR